MTEDQIAEILQPYLLPGNPVPSAMFGQLARYLELLLKWNAKTNLTSIREPQEIVRRHFGESLFAAQHIGPCQTLLDFGSGAGFPGLPVQLCRPEITVTLAESQNKKATFLREVVRTLGLKTEVWAGRVESMPPDRRFDVVTLRAVDNMPAAVAAAIPRAKREMLLLTTDTQEQLEGLSVKSKVSIPGSRTQSLFLLVP